MPTIQQLVRKGREVLVEKSKSPALDARLKGRCKGQALHHGHITGNRMHPQHIQNMLVQ